MKLKADLFPYPVLSRELDDYIGSDFYTEAEINYLSASNVELTISFMLRDETLSQLIKNEHAVYAVHLEGVSSSFRELHKLEPNKSSVTIPLNADKVSRKIEVNTMIIANDDFEDYVNPNFNPDYYDSDYSIGKVYTGDILAFDSMIDLNIDFTNREKPNAKSMIRVASKKQKYMTVDTDSDVIQVFPS